MKKYILPWFAHVGIIGISVLILAIFTEITRPATTTVNHEIAQGELPVLDDGYKYVIQCSARPEGPFTKAQGGCKLIVNLAPGQYITTVD